MREGHQVDKLHLVLEGVFELVKTIEFVDPNLQKEVGFDLKEFLP